MPLTAKGRKIKGAMVDQYGAKKGEQVFYASIAKGKITGAERGSAAYKRRTHRLKKGQAKVMRGTHGLTPDPVQRPDSGAVKRKSAGLRAREREVAELTEAAEGGSYQARLRLRPATSGLRRQRATAKRRGY